MSMWNTTMGAATAEFAYNQKKWKVGYVVTDTFIDYTKSLSRYFIQHFKKLGGTILFEDTYVQGAQDFSAQLARLKAAKKSEFIFISSYMPDLGTIIRTIREAGITVPIVGGDSYDDPGLFKALGEKYGSDIYFDTHSFLVPGVTPDMENFLKLYKAKFNAEPDAVWVATGWDVVMILTQAMQKAGSTDGAAMAKAMEGMEFNLLTGKLKWSDAASGHEPDIEAPLVQLDKSAPKFIGWVRPNGHPGALTHPVRERGGFLLPLLPRHHERQTYARHSRNHQGLCRAAGPGQRQPAVQPGGDPRPHRAQRLRQDHAHQRHHGAVPFERRCRARRRDRHHEQARVPHRALRDRPDLPDHPALPGADRSGERRGGRREHGTPPPRS